MYYSVNSSRYLFTQRDICTSLIIFLLLSIKTEDIINNNDDNNNTSKEVNTKYSWLDHNDIYDSMVGISVDGKPICSGVILDPMLILAPANPIERINDFTKINIHIIDGNPNSQRDYPVSFVTRDQAKRNSRGKWVAFGFDDRHSPLHDLVIITLLNEIKDLDDNMARHPIKVHGNPKVIFQSGGTFAFAGFGFIDKPHVKQNVELELVEYKYDDVWEDCWEWIPAIWGRFICLSNIENFVGISSGAGLFYNDGMDVFFVGIGSFSVKRGSESVLIFTDYRKYIGKTRYFIPVEYETNKTFKT